MAEQFEEVYVYVSTHGDGPKIDGSLAKALNAVQEGEFAILESRVTELEVNPALPGLVELGAILLRGEDEAEQASIYPVLLNQLAASIATLNLEISRG